MNSITVYKEIRSKYWYVPQIADIERSNMKLFTAILDTILLPMAIVTDIVSEPVKFIGNDHSDSETRKQVEKIDEDLKG